MGSLQNEGREAVTGSLIYSHLHWVISGCLQECFNVTCLFTSKQDLVVNGWARVRVGWIANNGYRMHSNYMRTTLTVHCTDSIIMAAPTAVFNKIFFNIIYLC